MSDQGSRETIAALNAIIESRAQMLKTDHAALARAEAEIARLAAAFDGGRGLPHRVHRCPKDHAHRWAVYRQHEGSNGSTVLCVEGCAHEVVERLIFVRRPRSPEIGDWRTWEPGDPMSDLDERRCVACGDQVTMAEVVGCIGEAVPS